MAEDSAPGTGASRFFERHPFPVRQPIQARTINCSPPARPSTTSICPQSSFPVRTAVLTAFPSLRRKTEFPFTIDDFGTRIRLAWVPSFSFLSSRKLTLALVSGLRYRRDHRSPP